MPSRIATYSRVSTADQNLDRQLESTAEYAQSKLDADLPDLDVYSDKSTGTDTARDDYLDMMDAVEDGAYDAVVVHSVSRISRSIRDLDRTAERVVEESDTELHIIKEGFVLAPGDDDPFQKALFRLLGVFAELEADLAQQRTREGLASKMASEDYSHGPAPLGYSKDNGQLVEGDNFHDVVSVLTMVDTGELSKRKAAGRLDTSRATIRRALDDRRELYAL